MTDGCQSIPAFSTTLTDVTERLLAAPVLRDHTLTAEMPPVTPKYEGQDLRHAAKERT